MKNEERILLEAFNQNWLHARHQEKQRLQLLTVYALITGAVLAFLSEVDVVSLRGAILLLFLSFFSFSVYFAFLKWNASFANHIIALQWISEKLGLIKEMQESRREDLKRKLPKHFRELPNYVYFEEAYMAFPLPLSVRVHEWLFTWFPRLLASLTLFFAVFALVYTVLVNTFAVAAGISDYIAFGLSIMMFLLSDWYCSLVLEKIKSEAKVFHEFRKPIEVRSWESGYTKLTK